MIEKIVLALFPTAKAVLAEQQIERQMLDQTKQFASDSIDKALLDIDSLQHDRRLCANISRILVKTALQIYDKDCDIKDIVARNQYRILTEHIVDLSSFCDNCERNIFMHNRKFAQRKGYSKVVAAVKEDLNDLRRMYGDLHL